MPYWIYKSTMYLVYGLPSTQVVPVPSPEKTDAIRYISANTDQINKFFGTDSRGPFFHKLSEQGYCGVFIVDGNEWVTYAWMSTPTSNGPSHLPAWARDLDAYWIFFCRTKAAYQGRGFYKQAIRLLINEARSSEIHCEKTVYIDTDKDNTPSRKAIATIGFEPQGTIITHRLKLPKIKLWLWGTWYKTAIHPV